MELAKGQAQPGELIVQSGRLAYMPICLHVHMPTCQYAYMPMIIGAERWDKQLACLLSQSQSEGLIARYIRDYSPLLSLQ